jgi:hypothetical protein
MTGAAPLWRIDGASARGASHIRSGRPNQDAVEWRPASSPASRISGAVSDGHGAAVHFRSDVGSRLATHGAADLLAWHMDDAETDEADVAIAGELVAHWQREVAAHAAANPYSEIEAVPPQASPLTPYGATLVAFAVNATMMLALQIGDGDLLIGYPDGRIERPLRADMGLVGEETYSLCLPDAVARFRTATLWCGSGDEWPDFIAATTDGVAKSYRDDAGFERAIGQLRHNAATDWAALVAALPGWLDDVSTHGSGDDATICIALRASPSEGS